ncbi:MAG: glycosyltransferase family 9 protein [Parafilimonas sp.]|nr:glycosyltransferase family 9 protein [Parafilimonas sp.]
MNIPAKPWTKTNPPKKILAIRLQAMGDVLITLPYLQHLRKSLPQSTQIDLLTREETESIPKNIVLFDKVFSIRGERNFRKQLFYAFLLLPKLLLHRYDVVIDLQNNPVSEIVRKVSMPKAWSVFDKFSPIAAGERTRLTIEAIGFKIKAAGNFYLKDPQQGLKILKANGWKETAELIAINPAGAFTTRSWSRENYIAFAKLWLAKFPDAKILMMGTSFIAAKAAFMKNELQERLINIVGLTTPAEAFAIMQRVKFMLSEDSGLMHMAWISGVPTLAMFGSTRSDWSKPLGEHTFFLDSSDLPCGNCMLQVCKFNDVRCLTRYTPEKIFQHALELVQKSEVMRYQNNLSLLK